MLTNWLQISLISSKIQATSDEHTLSEFKRSTNSAKLHSTIMFEKLVLWQKSKPTWITDVAVHKAWSSFLTCSHDAAMNSPFEFLISKPSPIDGLRNCNVQFEGRFQRRRWPSSNRGSSRYCVYLIDLHEFQRVSSYSIPYTCMTGLLILKNKFVPTVLYHP